MIGFLKGTIELQENQYVLINVNGVGYKVTASKDVLSANSVGSLVKIFTYTHVREDILELYGFSTREDLKLFELLISVSGVGPKTALGVFSVGSSSEILQALAKGNVDFFTQVPRLGRKNAQKIIIELKNKVGATFELDLSGADTKDNEEVLETLKALGFSGKEGLRALQSIKKDASTEEKVRLALKYLGK